MNSARYPKPSTRNLAETDASARAEGGGNGWYADTMSASARQGGGEDTRSGEKLVHSDCTIFDIREMWLFDEQINLGEGFSLDNMQITGKGVRDETLPWILSQ